MKQHFLIVFVIAFNFINAPQNISIESKGNLQSSNPCRCVGVSEVTGNNTPADILIGMRECVNLKEFDKAASLFAIAGVYGKYDTFRVKDKTAHQALRVLQQNIILDFDEIDRTNLMNSLNNQLEKGSTKLNNLCQAS